MKPSAGPILRRVGLLIELSSLLALVTLDDGRRAFAGVAARIWLIAGVALGFVVWGIGLALMIIDARRAGASTSELE